MGDLASPHAEPSLTRQEVELLQLLGQGLPLGTVARRLQTSERTVRRRTKAICDRMGVDTAEWMSDPAPSGSDQVAG